MSHASYQLQLQKLLALRDVYAQELQAVRSADPAFLSLPHFAQRLERMGQVQILSKVTDSLSLMTSEMPFDQVQGIILPLLDTLAEQKAAGMAFFHRNPLLRYRLDRLDGWRVKGVLEQIQVCWPQICACFLPRWQAQPWKHGCHFQVYHYQAECASDGEAIARWQGEQRASWFGEVAIIKTAPCESVEERLDEVSRLTGHREWTRSDAVLWSQVGVSPRPTSPRDVIVSVLSGRAWLVDRGGFRPL